MLNDTNRTISQRVDLTSDNSSDEDRSDNTFSVSTARGDSTSRGSRPARARGSRGGRRARGRAKAN